MCSLWEVSIQSRPIRFSKLVWGLPASTEDPKNEVVDILPRYGRYTRESTVGRPCSRFPCISPIAGQIIYYLTRGVPGVTRYFQHANPHKAVCTHYADPAGSCPTMSNEFQFFDFTKAVLNSYSKTTDF
jgi:hypothetical protein